MAAKAGYVTWAHTPPSVSHPGAASPGDLPAPPFATSRGEAALDRKPPADPDPLLFQGTEPQRAGSDASRRGCGGKYRPPARSSTDTTYEMDGGGPDPSNLCPAGRTRAQRHTPPAGPPPQEAPPLPAGSPSGRWRSPVTAASGSFHRSVTKLTRNLHV